MKLQTPLYNQHDSNGNGPEMPDADLETIEDAQRAHIVNDMIAKAGKPLTLLDLWQIRGFKYAKQRSYEFADKTGEQTRLAEVIVELGTTGVYQTGVGIVERSYNATAVPALRGRKGKVVQLNTRSVGGGNNRASRPIFEGAGPDGQAAIKAWKLDCVAKFNTWLKANNIADTSAADNVFDEVDK